MPDPDDTLAELRALVAVWEDGREPFDRRDYDRAIELARDLDRLAGKGITPAAWHPRHHITR